MDYFLQNLQTLAITKMMDELRSLKLFEIISYFCKQQDRINSETRRRLKSSCNWCSSKWESKTCSRVPCWSKLSLRLQNNRQPISGCRCVINVWRFSNDPDKPDIRNLGTWIFVPLPRRLVDAIERKEMKARIDRDRGLDHFAAPGYFFGRVHSIWWANEVE